MVESLSTLQVSLVYGEIADYLENQTALAERIAEGERELQRSASPSTQLRNEPA